MRIVFRVDAAAHIGIGHFMRCLTLADALVERGATARFVTRYLGAPLCALLTQRGHEHVAVSSPAREPGPDPVPHASWLGTSQEADARDTLNAIERGADWLVVDHYALDARWESGLRGAVRRIMVIDDVADRRHDCDVLLDQNLFPDAEQRYAAQVSRGCVQLLGPRYALLRPEFAALRAQTPARRGEVRRILVSLGGIDAGNQTMKVIRAIDSLRSTDLDVDVVIGAEHSARAAIEQACAERGFACHVAPRDLARLMAAADLAIGASGSTSWERCCIGTPTLLITQAANQVPIAAGLAACGAAVCVGDGHSLDERQIGEGLASLVSDPERIRAISTAARELVDGLGANRVCDRLTA